VPVDRSVSRLSNAAAAVASLAPLWWRRCRGAGIRVRALSVPPTS